MSSYSNFNSQSHPRIGDMQDPSICPMFSSFSKGNSENSELLKLYETMIDSDMNTGDRDHIIKSEKCNLNEGFPFKN